MVLKHLQVNIPSKSSQNKMLLPAFVFYSYSRSIAGSRHHPFASSVLPVMGIRHIILLFLMSHVKMRFIKLALLKLPLSALKRCPIGE